MAFVELIARQAGLPNHALEGLAAGRERRVVSVHGYDAPLASDEALEVLVRSASALQFETEGLQHANDVVVFEGRRTRHARRVLRRGKVERDRFLERSGVKRSAAVRQKQAHEANEVPEHDEAGWRSPADKRRN